MALQPAHQPVLAQHDHIRRALAHRHPLCPDDRDDRRHVDEHARGDREQLRRARRLVLRVAEVVGALPVHEDALRAHPHVLPAVVLSVNGEHPGRPDHDMVDIARPGTYRYRVQHVPAGPEPGEPPPDLEFAERARVPGLGLAPERRDAEEALDGVVRWHARLHAQAFGDDGCRGAAVAERLVDEVLIQEAPSETGRVERPRLPGSGRSRWTNRLNSYSDPENSWRSALSWSQYPSGSRRDDERKSFDARVIASSDSWAGEPGRMARLASTTASRACWTDRRHASRSLAYCGSAALTRSGRAGSNARRLARMLPR